MSTAGTVLLRPDRQVGADFGAWCAAGGGAGLAAALARPEAIIPAIREADLRGMGGAGFPTWRKWTAVTEQAGAEKVAGQSGAEKVAGQSGAEKYVVCNGNEDEPGTFKDRVLLRDTPHQVIEGALIAAIATGARRLVFYIHPHQHEGIAAMRAAIAQWQAGPLLPKVAAALGGAPEMRVHPGTGHYVGGEDTAVVATLEGGFPFPRRKPPFPAETGVHGCPTLVNNVETLANVPHILREGAAWYRALGIGAAAGTKLYSLSGDVLNPGLYELPMGTSLQSLIFDHGGGMLGGKAFKAVFTGGPSNTLLTAADLDVALDFDSVRSRRSRLGTGAMIVISEGTSIVRKVAEYIDFFAAGSCGQCPPCKTGTFQLARLLERIDTGRGNADDIAALRSLCAILPGSGRCGLIDGAVTVVDSSLHAFPGEYGIRG